MSAATIDHFAASIEAALGATWTAPGVAPAHAYRPLSLWESSEYPAPLRAAHAATQTRPTRTRDGRPVVTTNGRPVVAGRK